MFIKIGDMIINTENVTRVMRVTGQRVEFEFNTPYGGDSGDEGYTEPFGIQFIYTDPAYPQALAAYDWFCKAAIRFDDNIPATEAAPQADSDTNTESDESDAMALETPDMRLRAIYRRYAIYQMGFLVFRIYRNRKYVASETTYQAAKAYIDDRWSSPVASTQGSGASGERRFHYHIDSGNFHTHIRRGELPDSTSEIIVTFDDDDLADTYAETCVEAIENETAALRSQVAALTSELESTKARVAGLLKANGSLETSHINLSDTIQKAYDILVSPANPVDIALVTAAQVLRPFTDYADRD